MRVKEACKSSSVQRQSPCRNDAARRPSDGKLLLYTAHATIGLACPPPSGTTTNRMTVVVNENKQQDVTNLKRKNQSRLSILHVKILQARRHAKQGSLQKQDRCQTASSLLTGRSLSTSMKWRRKQSLANDTSNPIPSHWRCWKTQGEGAVFLNFLGVPLRNLRPKPICLHGCPPAR